MSIRPGVEFFPVGNSQIDVNARRLAEWQITLWGIFLACFVGAGALPLGAVRFQRRTDYQGPYNSVDALLRDEVGLKNGAAKISSMVAELPKDSNISVVYCSTGFDALAGVLTSQILFPRPVEEFRCISPQGSDLDTKKLRERGGVAFFIAIMPAEDLGEVTPVGGRVYLVKIVPPR